MIEMFKNIFGLNHSIDREFSPTKKDNRIMLLLVITLFIISLLTGLAFISFFMFFGILYMLYIVIADSFKKE